MYPVTYWLNICNRIKIFYYITHHLSPLLFFSTSVLQRKKRCSEVWAPDERAVCETSAVLEDWLLQNRSTVLSSRCFLRTDIEADEGFGSLIRAVLQNLLRWNFGWSFLPLYDHVFSAVCFQNVCKYRRHNSTAMVGRRICSPVDCH